ncbi:MAG: Fic family protein [Micrococcales bacterium]|nr:Fic family protein [Micrococcales bacterium]
MSEMSERIRRTFAADAGGDHSRFARIDRLVDVWHGLAPLSANESAGLASFEAAFEVRFVHGSNAIEGSTLTPGETALVLDGEFVPERPGKDYFAARGSADGMAYYRKAIATGRPLSEELVRDIHERTALDCQPAVRGVYRQYPVYLPGRLTVPVNWAAVPALMDDLVSQYTQSAEHPVYTAAAFHALFENVHPFADGNGRTGRLALNYMLEKADYPPIAISAERRAQYLDALENWQAQDDEAPLLALVTDAVAQELEARIACVMDTRSPRV